MRKQGQEGGRDCRLAIHKDISPNQNLSLLFDNGFRNTAGFLLARGAAFSARP
jgi:hypothetical protein